MDEAAGPDRGIADRNPDVAHGPAPADAAYVRERIYEYNEAAAGYRDGRPIGCVIRDRQGRIVAGIDGFSWGGYARIEFLWVDQALRGQGVGRALMTAVLDEARERGCASIVVDSHSFQAPGFYLRLGFVEVGRTHGTPIGHDQVLFQLSLAGGPRSSDPGERPPAARD